MAAALLQRALVGLQQLSAIGSGSREERLRRAMLLLLSLFTCIAGALWGFSYWLIGHANGHDGAFRHSPSANGA